MGIGCNQCREWGGLERVEEGLGVRPKPNQMGELCFCGKQVNAEEFRPVIGAIPSQCPFMLSELLCKSRLDGCF